MITDVNEKKRKLSRLIEAATTISIVGHIRPDGDCVGSALGLYNYIISNYENKQVKVFLQEFSLDFNFLNGANEVIHTPDNKCYDLCISVDSADQARHGEFGDIFNNAITTVCIDHHVSNQGYGDLCYIDAEASSCAEVICDLIDLEMLDKYTSEAIYLGIVHDTGVFKYSSTSRKTMELAGLLIDKGADPSFIIDETFYKKTYTANLLMAKAINKSKLHNKKRIISTVLTRQDMEELKATKLDTEGIVEQLRLTDKVELAIFIYPSGEKGYKASLRSKRIIDCNVIAQSFLGGGHVRAAGFTFNEGTAKVIDKVIKMAEAQFEKETSE